MNEYRKDFKNNRGAFVETYIYNPFFQDQQFTSPVGIPLEGEVSLTFDTKGCVSTTERADSETMVQGIFRFKNGYLHAIGMPALEYPGHKEYWQNGHIQKVCADYEAVVEDWYAGFPVLIDIRQQKSQQQ